ncbi:MAG TPA: hypothetical protein VGJ26_01175 [Pirellulales bacterium]
MTQLRWIASGEASALHAAAALADGRKIVDQRLTETLAEPVERLVLELGEQGAAPGAFFEHAIPLACQVDEVDPVGLAHLALARSTDRPRAPGESYALAAALMALFRTQERIHPDLANQLRVRMAPLVEQWEARGPGLLAAIGRMTDPGLLVKQADVAVVYPALGGGGAASPTYNLVRIEAVLANPHAALPEVVRLGWLIAQLGLKASRSAVDLSDIAFERFARLAMVPAALEAAEHVELARWDESTLNLALVAWGLADETSPQLASSLLGWWEERRLSDSQNYRTRFLDRLLNVKVVSR